MSGRCSNPRCFVHEGQSCDQGETPYTDCPHWVGQVEGDATVPTYDYQTTRVPWSGSALGLADLAQLTTRGRHILIGVLGAHDAGKTTLLTACYLQLLRGQSIGEFTFAGSRTLGAWESLAAHTRFDDPVKGPAFPPHTPRGTQRVPGLLHLALRNQQDEHRDVFLTDAPGEWFTRWAVKEDAPEAEGAHWTAQNADAFIVFADCKRLGGSECGSARREIRQLIERLSKHVGRRPVLFVWAKNDCDPDQKIQEAILDTLKKRIPQAQEVGATITCRETLNKALGEIAKSAWYSSPAQAVAEPTISHQPFYAYRSHHA